MLSSKSFLLFWFDSFSKNLHKCTIDIASKEELDNKYLVRNKKNTVTLKNDNEKNITSIFKSTEKPVGLSIDWITMKIYSINTEKLKVFSMDMDGRNITSLVSSGRYPIDIIVDPDSR